MLNIYRFLKLKTLRKLKLIFLKINTQNISLGKEVVIDIKTRIHVGKNKLVIGNNVYLRSESRGYHAGMPFPTTILLDGKNSTCFIGDNCRINGAYIHAQENINIGKNTVIAAGVNIIDSNGHELYSSNRTNGRDMPSGIEIGNNVWIGLNAVVLKGSVIGDNSVIAAGSVVKGSFPKNALLQGNPAQIVKILDLK